jgi:RimJ/RimL family protein N-acetyltransferase
MTPRLNEHGQPIGFALSGWTPPPHPPRQKLAGTYCRVEPLDPEKHSAELHSANSLDPSGRAFTYLSSGPFDSLESYRQWITSTCLGHDPLFHAIIDGNTGKAVGVAAYMRIDPSNGVIEVGHLNFSPLLQQTRAATEAMHLMMRNAFAIGYRRYEWKCDSLNAPSRAAAQRLGFSYEGRFIQAIAYKGRNRDTDWFSVTDREWPAIHRAHGEWLAPENFDAQGRQRSSLSALTAPLLRSTDNT